MACAGQAWSCTFPHTDVTQVAIARRPYRPLLPMPTLLAGVRTRDRQRHVQAAVGSNTSSKAREQVPGQIANEKCLMARSSATMRERQRLYIQYTLHSSRQRKTTVSRNQMRQTVTHSTEGPK